MMERIDKLLYRFRFVLIGVLGIAGLLVLLVALSVLVPAPRTTAASYQMAASYDSANAVTNGLAMMSDDVIRAVDSTGQASANALHSLGTSIGSSGSFLVTGSRAVGHGVGVAAIATGHGIATGTTATIRGVANGLVFIARIPANLLGFVTEAPGMNLVIRPADHEAVPVIDPNSPALKSAIAALPPAQAASQPAQAAAPAIIPEWPIHGAITTEFGVPEPPYEPIHTGIDISDGAPSGVTPVHPYRPGTVIGTLTSGGLGNHVIIDHGNGVTSVYGHMSSIKVSIGQKVDQSTVIGYEGTTGVSTGPHVHFEIHVNGQAANPHQFINGRP